MPVQHNVIALAAVPNRLGVVAVARVELLADERTADRGIVFDVRAVAGIPVPRQNRFGDAGNARVGSAVAGGLFVYAVHIRPRQIQIQMVTGGVRDSTGAVRIERFRIVYREVLRTRQTVSFFR